jgi:hypothetical protein
MVFSNIRRWQNESWKLRLIYRQEHVVYQLWPRANLVDSHHQNYILKQSCYNAASRWFVSLNNAPIGVFGG